MSPRLPWLQSHLQMTGFTPVLSPTPGGGMILMIGTFPRIVTARDIKSKTPKMNVHLEARSMNKSRRATHRGQTEASGVSVSPRRPDKRSPIICCCGSRPPPPLSPRAWLCLEGQRNHHSPKRGQDPSGGTLRSLRATSPSRGALLLLTTVGAALKQGLSSSVNSC